MSEIVLITGSPRLNGNSSRMAAAFAIEAADLGHEVKRFDAFQMNLSGCRACGACFQEMKPCPFEPKFTEPARAVMDADAIVLASPLYWYGFPGRLKNFIDQFYCLIEGGADFHGKKTALMACCADESVDAFEGMLASYRKTADFLGMEIVDEILIPNASSAGDIRKTDGLQRAKALAGRFHE